MKKHIKQILLCLLLLLVLITSAGFYGDGELICGIAACITIPASMSKTIYCTELRNYIYSLQKVRVLN